MNILTSFPKKINKTKKRLGRGIGSGKGKTSGRGTKGQKSRSGYNIPRRFEGGQNSLISRLPKNKGFRAKDNKSVTITFDKLSVFEDGETINRKKLLEKNLINKKDKSVKIVLKGKINKKFKFQRIKVSASIKKNHTSS